MMISSTILVSFIFFIPLLSAADDAKKWNYKEGNYGPKKWEENFPDCNTTAFLKQSPINIKTSETKYKEKKSFEMNDAYKNDEKDQFFIENDGHTIKMSVVEGKKDKILEGGDLKHKYKFAQLHMHWGKTKDEGSEHYIDGKASPLEIHLVHYDMDNYKNISEAAKKDKGLTVIGVMVEMGKSSPVFEKLMNVIPKIEHKNKNYSIDDELSLKHFLPSDYDKYYRYIGSLTTPPCAESVIWSLMKYRLTISEEQMGKIRNIYSTEENAATDEKISGNHRPLQELNGREITRSYKNGSFSRFSVFHWGLSLAPLLFHYFLNKI